MCVCMCLLTHYYSIYVHVFAKYLLVVVPISNFFEYFFFNFQIVNDMQFSTQITFAVLLFFLYTLFVVVFSFLIFVV